MLSKPPKDVEPSELFLKLLEPHPSEVIDFPRKGPDGKPVGRIRIQVLSQEHHERATKMAYRYLTDSDQFSQDDLKNVGLKELLGDRIAKELLAMACFTEKSAIDDANTGNPIYGRIFANADDIGKLRSQEVSVLFNAYLLIQEKFGPHEHNCDVDAWVNRLAEGGNAFPLLSLALPDLAEVTCSLADRISTICQLLGSQWSTLPSTLQSDLERYCSGIGSWYVQQENSAQDSTESRDDDFSLDVDDAIALDRRTRSFKRDIDGNM